MQKLQGKFRGRWIAVAVVWAASLAVGSAVQAADDRAIELGRFRLAAPADWEKRPPRSQLVSYEYAAPAAEGDTEGGRLTVMAAGGGVQANIDRWMAQFTQPDGSSTKDKTKTDKKTVADQTVHLVDISGTYDDKPAPFAPGVKKPRFRMLAAIIETDEASFFIKFYGPQRTIAEHEKEFQSMIDGLRVP